MLLLSGCSAAALSDDAPARLAAPSAACHAQIEQAASGWAGAPVKLAPTLLVEADSVSLERARSRDTEGRQRDGRSLERPLRLRLLQVDGQCVLASEHARASLPACRCAPSAPAPAK